MCFLCNGQPDQSSCDSQGGWHSGARALVGGKKDAWGDAASALGYLASNANNEAAIREAGGVKLVQSLAKKGTVGQRFDADFALDRFIEHMRDKRGKDVLRYK